MAGVKCVLLVLHLGKKRRTRRAKDRRHVTQLRCRVASHVSSGHEHQFTPRVCLCRDTRPICPWTPPGLPFTRSPRTRMSSRCSGKQMSDRTARIPACGANYFQATVFFLVTLLLNIREAPAASKQADNIAARFWGRMARHPISSVTQKEKDREEEIGTEKHACN